MSELLNSGQVGLTTLRNLSEQRKTIIKNWENSGLLFYMDARVSTNKVAPQNTANNQAGPTFSNNSAYERFYDNRGYDASFGTATTAYGTAMSVGSGSTTTGLIETGV